MPMAHRQRRKGLGFPSDRNELSTHALKGLSINGLKEMKRISAVGRGLQNSGQTPRDNLILQLGPLDPTEKKLPATSDGNNSRLVLGGRDAVRERLVPEPR